MSPYPMDPVDATGPMRIVLCTFPTLAAAEAGVDRALSRRLAACAQLTPVRSEFWWRGRRERADETLVAFKTVPKRVGALFRALSDGHPYEVPEVIEIDVPRVHAPYLAYLAQTLDADAPPPPLGGGRAHVRRPAGRRGPGARRPARTRARPPRP